MVLTSESASSPVFPRSVKAQHPIPFAHLLSQQISIECLQCVRNCARCQEYNNEQKGHGCCPHYSFKSVSHPLPLTSNLLLSPVLPLGNTLPSTSTTTTQVQTTFICWLNLDSIPIKWFSLYLFLTPFLFVFPTAIMVTCF